MVDLSILLAMSAQQIIIIVVLVLLLFGGRKIPELMRGLGRGVKEFKDGVNDINGDGQKNENTNTNNNNDSDILKK